VLGFVERNGEGRFSFYKHMRGEYKVRVGGWIAKQERERAKQEHQNKIDATFIKIKVA
jgi:hypothetical protein